jgi:hypothetical protein
LIDFGSSNTEQVSEQRKPIDINSLGGMSVYVAPNLVSQPETNKLEDFMQPAKSEESKIDAF